MPPTMKSRRPLSLLVLTSWVLVLLCQRPSSPVVAAFTTRTVSPSFPSRRRGNNHRRSSPILVNRSCSLEENAPFRSSLPPLVMDTTTTTTARSSPWMISRLYHRLSNKIRIDRGQLAKMGVSFAVTYNVVSNINGSIFFSLAWYIASRQTGLSPLAPGNWKALLAAYGGLYMFVTIMRPLRLALAVSLTRTTSEFVENIQTRLGCNRATAIGMFVSLSMLLWMGCVAGGVTIASAAAGVSAIP